MSHRPYDAPPCIQQATAWRVPYDAAIDQLTAALKAAKISKDTRAVAASQAALSSE